MIGQIISHYKILEKLGAGGMGVVYKAHDTELDRDVALKFLPRDVSLSEEERTRFIHEAKAASALEHPNICTIHHVERTPDGQMFIVMGYYDGQSISKKVEKGRLDVDEAVSIAIQIAEGLQAAHEKGIVHRDIKSSNVIVSDKGQVRILDFGLARRKGLSKLTKTGTTIGTASYMSPEQAQGGSVDQRTDLWSLGIVLYEMVTGRLPFRGEHEAAILYAVVNEQPRPIEESVSSASPELIHIIGRALEKDPAERYKTAEDVLIDLRRLKKETSRTGFSPTRGTKKKIPFFRNKVFISVIIIVSITAAFYLTLIKKGVEINPDHSLGWMNLPFSTIGSGPAISPDGKWIVFGAEDKNKRWDLYAVSLEGGEPRPITHDSSDRALFPDISPNGTNIIYNQVSGSTYNICIVPFNGGIGKKIGVGNKPLWSPDGKRIGYVLDPIQLSANTSPLGRAASKSGNGEFWTMNPDGSNNTLEFTDTVAAKNDSRVCFAWSLDGRTVAWSRKNYQEHCEILLHDLMTHTERSLVSEGLSSMVDLCWTYNDQIIYSTMINGEMNLRMVLIKGGVPIVITKGLGVVQHPRISADGRTLIFLQNKLFGHLWLAKTDGSGDRTEVKVGGEPYFRCPSISPDGKYITVVIQTLGGAYVRQIFILSRDGSDRHQITTGTVNNLYFWPTWSPDGKKIFYFARGINEPFDSFRVYVVNVPKIDVPYCLGLGWSASWVDSVSLNLQDYKTLKMWRVFLDGRPRQPFSEDSIWARTVGWGKYVMFWDMHQRARLAHEPERWCRIEAWDGIGPKNAKALPEINSFDNYDALYLQSGSDIYRVSFPEWKMIKLKVNTDDKDDEWSGISTTRDGKEMIYSSTDRVNKIGVIENLFK